MPTAVVSLRGLIWEHPRRRRSAVRTEALTGGIPKTGEAFLCRAAIVRRTMKLRLFILASLAAAALAANASAAQQLQTISRDGIATTSRSSSGSCGFESEGGDLVLVCTGSKGNAVALYDFYLPDNLYGTPAMYVYGEKLCCESSSIGKKLVKVSKLHYRIRVAVSKRTRFDLQSVSLSYYVKT